ncbi:Uma2 family endonuclease [Candidatus Magnetominusculus dajiuhuensis]|uniref:Uma2 family endonuclease n=1 Tax=Candidatus Magnetominusculus dajiuhuensis TaxID=3137712 RepID=UPI003B42AF36
MEAIVSDLDLTEIINGEEIMGPSPFGRHQDVAANLFDIMRQHVRKNHLGKLLFSPLDVIFEEGINRLQPDILFIRKENMGIFQDWIRGVPDMVCEIISPGSFEKDTEVKKAIYEKYRVPEYWVVIPELQTVEVLTIENDRYKKHCIAELEGTVTSKVIEGLQINVTDIFGQQW